MNSHKNPDVNIWDGRISDQKSYLHEKVVCSTDFESDKNSFEKTIAILGYACDEGVKRNQGRVGAESGPDAIRKQLAKMPNHLEKEVRLLDVGTVQCHNGNMEAAQEALSEKVTLLLESNCFPILLGGGHDIAYGHYSGIKKYLGKKKSIGIINFDAHFDLRDSAKGGTSGTPFFQIGTDCKMEKSTFHYLCLGIRKDANDKVLFKTAENLGVTYLKNLQFTLRNAQSVVSTILDFLREVDHVYVTIDLDGFSSAYAPGVSAPSPLGFSPGIVLECLELIIKSEKLISLDIAEMNPEYDIDDQTAKLAASLVHFVMHKLA